VAGALSSVSFSVLFDSTLPGLSVTDKSVRKGFVGDWDLKYLSDVH